MPAKLKAKAPESVYHLKRQSASLVRLRLHIVLKNEMHPSRLINSTKKSYYWRKCRRQIVALYCQKYKDQTPICPILFCPRLPPEDVLLKQIRAWNKALV